MKCPACGAVVDSMAIKCPECGYIFSAESDSGKDIRERIDLFQQQLLNTSNIDEKAALIRTFTLPKTLEGLMSMLSLASSSFESSNRNEEMIISSAWLEKARETYRILKSRAGSDRHILEQIKDYSFLENTEIRAKESLQKTKKRSIIRWIIIGVVLILLIYFILLILSNLDVDESTEKTVQQEVMELIQEKEYEKARVKAMEAEYSWERDELMQMIDKAEL